MRTEILDNGTRVLTAPGAQFGSDALLLARFCTPRPQETAADLGSGCGIVALCWHDAGHRGRCTAVEVDPAASALCAKAVRENGPAAAHIEPRCADLRGFCTAAANRGLWWRRIACRGTRFSARQARTQNPKRKKKRLLRNEAAAAGCTEKQMHQGKPPQRKRFL